MISLMASVPPVLTPVFASPVVRETRRAPNELLSHRGLAPGELTTYEPLAAQWRRPTGYRVGPAPAVSQGGRQGLAGTAGRQASTQDHEHSVGLGNPA
jgi:hypothetical protein